MSFAGTRFENLENSIKSKINRKRKQKTDNHNKNESDSINIDEIIKKKSKADKKNSLENEHKKKNSSEIKTDQNLDNSNVEVRHNVKQTNNLNIPSSISDKYINERTIYIQGLPFSCTENDIKHFFKEITDDIQSIRLPKWHDSGKSKGYGHVEFKNAEIATKALDFNGQYIQDRYVSIDRPQVPRVFAEPHIPSKKPAGCRTIYIKNLPYEITESEISEQFKVYGPIQNIRLSSWNHTGKMKGFGYIDYKREDSAEIAVKKSGSIILQDRNILVDFESNKPKLSFKKQLK